VFLEWFLPHTSRVLLCARPFLLLLQQWAIFGLCRGQPAAAWVGRHRESHRGGWNTWGFRPSFSAVAVLLLVRLLVNDMADICCCLISVGHLKCSNITGGRRLGLLQGDSGELIMKVSKILVYTVPFTDNSGLRDFGHYKLQVWTSAPVGHREFPCRMHSHSFDNVSGTY